VSSMEARHVDGIDRGRWPAGTGARVVPLHKRGGDERHPARDHVHGNHVEAFALVRRKLAKIGAEKIRKRAGGVDTFVPSGEGACARNFRRWRGERWQWKARAPVAPGWIRQGLFVNVYVLGQPRCCARFMPARTRRLRTQRARLRFVTASKFTRSDFRRIACTAKGLAAKGFRQFRTFRPLLDALNHFKERSDFPFRHRNRDGRRDCSWRGVLR